MSYRVASLSAITILLIAGSYAFGDDAEHAEPFIAPTTTTRPPALSVAERVQIRVELDAERATTTSLVPSILPAATSSTTTTTLVPESARCPEWWVVAVGAGWPTDPAILGTLDWLMWRESRCQPDAIGDGSYGLTQIQWNVHADWIRDLGFERDHLLEPAANLALAWHLYRIVDNDPAYRCGFSPWYPSQPGKHWCTVMEDMA